MRRIANALVLTAALCATAPALACPNCKEAASAAIDEGDDPLREAKAYNYSIYFMLSVLYSIVGVGGLYCYKHVRRTA